MDGLILGTVAITIVTILCCTGLTVAKLYYLDRKEQRLERLDVFLQKPELLPQWEDRLILEEIASIANKRATTNSVGHDVLDTLVEHHLITPQRARYVKE